MGELIGEACVPLIRAVELFDVQLGNRFSTYATWAVRNHMIRCLKKRQSQQGQRIPCDQVWFDRLPDHRSNPEDDNREIAHRTELVQSLLNLLDERCGGVFERIDDVISAAERDEFMRRYKTAAGFAIEKLNGAAPLIAPGARALR
jgi:RNA polymerase sigma factor (sigma-70 family)